MSTAPTNNNTQSDDNTLKVTNEIIGWSFIRYYYENLSSSPADLYLSYSVDAQVVHDDYEAFLVEENQKLIEVKAKGAADVKEKIYSKMSAEDNYKVMVSHADILDIGLGGTSKTILIVVLGEIAKGDSPAFNFSQTFTITAVPNREVYDVTNDVFRFIPLDDEASFEETEDVAAKEDKVEAAVAVATEEKKEESDKELAKNIEEKKVDEQAAAITSPDPVIESDGMIECEKKESVEEPATADSTMDSTECIDEKKKDTSSAATSVGDISTAATSAVSTPGKNEEPPFQKTTPTQKKETVKNVEKQSSSTAKFSWAATAAKGANESKPLQEESKPKAKQSQLQQPKQKAAPKNAETSPVVKDTPKEAIKDDGFDVVSKRGAKNQTKKVKKTIQYESNVTAYPVYIRLEKVKTTDAELKTTLEAKYGKVYKCVIKDNIALVDFCSADSQESSIKAGQLEIANGKIKIEQRFSKPQKKPYFNHINGNKKKQNGVKTDKSA
ncbi:Bre5 protein [Saccharomycopsis crataegensis]|uniref:Bre5 protein n=1 Tax=Saccharomycopsis crataegensis TaxID=43959 RepID=A0AAV5QGT9_9ASCO|nr:Bre5 protein [Saccharomycopsis crataegensis]